MNRLRNVATLLALSAVLFALNPLAPRNRRNLLTLRQPTRRP